MRDLTKREREVAELMAQGYKDSEIAERLACSPKTIKAHSQNLFHKLSIHRRIEVAGALLDRERIPDLAEAHSGGETCC